MSEAVVCAGEDLEANVLCRKLSQVDPRGISSVSWRAYRRGWHGYGFLSELILETDPETLSLVEPSEMYSQLVPRASRKMSVERAWTFTMRPFRAEAATLTEKQGLTR